jgi:H+/Na+-translocating ferredoxin:NAD+ oxidoreductase subunit A
MSDLLVILIGTVLVNNFVLTSFLGLCPFVGVSGRYESAVGMAFATLFVLTLASALSFLVEHYALEPFGLEYLRTLTFILVIAAVVQFTEIVIRRMSPVLHQILGVFLPLITTNCAVLGVALLNVQRSHTFLESVVFGCGAAGGFALVLAAFAALRERLRGPAVPGPFHGAPIALVTAGIMALAFMGFSGLVRS